jgi:hypothetical protein
MQLVACPRCGAQFDVSAFAPGTKFVCGACKNMLQVPAAAPAAPVVAPVVAPAPPSPAAAPRAPARAPSAAAARKEEAPTPEALSRKPAVDRRRAGDAAPAQAAPSGRAGRLRAQRAAASEGKGRKNPLPLVLGGVGVLALVGVGIAFALGGKGDGASSATADGGGAEPLAPGKGGASAKGEPAKPVEKTWEDLGPSERLALAELKKKEGLASAAAVREAHAWLESKGLAGDAQSFLGTARGKFPEDAWILGKLGLVDRSDDIRKAATDEEVLFAVSAENPDLQMLQTLHDRLRKEKSAGWLSKEDAEKFDRAVASLREQVGRMSDPIYQRTNQEYQNLKNNPAFTGVEFSFEAFRPYTVFVELPGAERRELADRVVKATGTVLSFVYERWLRFMKEDLGLEVPRMEDLNDERFKVFVFKSRESFDAWHTRNGVPTMGPSIAAYYQHGRDRMIVMHLDAFSPGTIMHEGTHQLIHFYARHFCQKDDDARAEKAGEPKEKVQYEDGRLRSGFFWFQEGIAEYFGVEVKEKGKADEWKIGSLQPDRLVFFKMMQGQGKTWSLEDFLFADQGQIYNRAGVKGGGTMTDEMKGLMYSQGWVLVHYLLHGEGEKWRAPFLKVIRNELSGVTGKPALLQAFGLPNRSDDPKVQAWMKEIEAGYLKHFEKLMKDLTRAAGEK